jgi:hypothetical protein
MEEDLEDAELSASVCEDLEDARTYYIMHQTTSPKAN